MSFNPITLAQGADGYLSFFTGKDNIAGDNDLFWDRANNRLGIGVGSPYTNLHVKNNSKSEIALFGNTFGEGDTSNVITTIHTNQTSGNYAGLYVGRGGNTGQYITCIANGLNIGTTPDGATAGIFYGTAGGVSGYTGIGTISPTNPLHIKKSNGTQLLVESTDTNWTGLTIKSSTTEGYIQSQSSGTIVTIGSTGLLNFRTNSVDVGRWNTSGYLNIGSGDSSPYRLTLRGDGASHYNTALALMNVGTNARVYTLSARNDGHLWIADDSAGLARLVVKSSGRIVIGSGSTDTEMLDVDGLVGNTVAKFGSGLCIYVIASHPIIGYNVYYNGGYIFGKGSSSNYAAMAGFNPSAGELYWGISSGTGNANASASMSNIMTLSSSKLLLNTTYLELYASSADQRFISPLVTHGMTSVAPTNVAGRFVIDTSTIGGLRIQGFTESVTGTFIQAYVTSEDGTTTTSSSGAIELSASKSIGGGATGPISSSANLVTISNDSITRFILKSTGDLYTDTGSIGAYDDYQDALACRDMMYAASNDLQKVIHYNKERLAEMKVLSDDGRFLHVQNSVGLMLGGIGELYHVLTYVLNKLGLDYETIRKEIRSKE